MPREGRLLPVYTVTVRSAKGAPTVELFIDAASAGQARADAAARGYFVDSVALTPRDRIGEGDVVVADDPAVAPLDCTRCGYSLDGLSVKAGRIRCPECGTENRIFVLGPAATIIRSTERDVEKYRLAATEPFRPGRTIGIWSVVFGVVGLGLFGAALLAFGLGALAYERSQGYYGKGGMGLGGVGVILHLLWAFTTFVP